MALSSETWAIIGAGVAIAGGFTAGALLRRRDQSVSGTVTISQAPAIAAATKKRPRFQLRLGPGFVAGGSTPLERLTAVLQAYVSLADSLIEAHGPLAADWTYSEALRWPASAFAEGTYGRVHGDPAAGFVWDLSDVFTMAKHKSSSFAKPGPNTLAFSTAARKRWDADPEALIAAIEDDIAQVLTALSASDDTASVKLGDQEVSLWELAEEWATDAAIDYLATSIPGGDLVLAAGSALGGPGWNYGMTTVQQADAKGWDQVRALVLERAADLLSYAGA